MIKQIIELLLVVVIGMLPMGADSAQNAEIGAVSESAVVAEVSCQQSDGVKAARFQNILNHNLCFGESFTKEQVKISAEVALLSQINDGFIDKTAVDRFVLDMYGIDLSEETAENGLYAVPAISYDVFFHTVDSFSYNGDGTVTVKSVMSVNGEGEYPCESVFFADGASLFGYTLLSCVAVW